MEFFDKNDPRFHYKTLIARQRITTNKQVPWVESLPQSDLITLLTFIYYTEFLPRHDEIHLDLLSAELELPPVPQGLTTAARKEAYDERHVVILEQIVQDTVETILLGREMEKEAGK